MLPKPIETSSKYKSHRNELSHQSNKLFCADVELERRNSSEKIDTNSIRYLEVFCRLPVNSYAREILKGRYAEIAQTDY